MCMAWGRLSTSITMFPSKMIPTEDALWWRDCVCGVMFSRSWQRSPLAHHCMDLPHHQRPEKRNRAWSHQHDNTVLQTPSIGTQPICLPYPVSTHCPVQPPLQEIPQDRCKKHPQMIWGEHRSHFWSMPPPEKFFFLQTTITIIKKKILTHAHLKIICRVGREEGR